MNLSFTVCQRCVTRRVPRGAAVLGAVLLVAAVFGSSEELASAYSMSVTVTRAMAIELMLATFVNVRWS
jgi:K+ transporter